MAHALRVKQNFFKLNVDDPIQDNDDSLHRIISPNVLGVVVNIKNNHWIAYRLVNDEIWLLDSEKRLSNKLSLNIVHSSENTRKKLPSS